MTQTQKCWHAACRQPAREGYTSCAEHAGPGARLGGPSPVPVAPVVPVASSGSWGSAAAFMWVLTALSLVGGIAFGAALITHSGQSCSVNPYDTSLSLCTGTHPYRSDGAIVIVVGLVQAVAYGIVAKLCTVVGELRTQR